MSNKSTIVRISSGAMRAASFVVPGVVGREAGRRFFRPDRGTVRVPEVPGVVARPFDVRLDDLRLSAWAFGEGPTVLLSHGWESQASHWGAWIGALVQEGFRVVVWDQPAHGRSEGTTTNGYEMSRAIGAVARGEGRIHALIGHSVGGTAALAAVTGAADGGPLQVDRLVLVAPVSAVEYPIRHVESVAGLSARACAAFRAEIERTFGRPIVATDVERWVEGMPSLPGALLFHDPRDKEVPIASSERVVQSWRGRAELREVSGLGHRRILRDGAIISAALAFMSDDERPVARTSTTDATMQA